MSRSASSRLRRARAGANVATVARYAARAGGARRSPISCTTRPTSTRYSCRNRPTALGGVASAIAAAGLKSAASRARASGTIRASPAIPALQGAWYSAPETAGFNAFAKRYRDKYNADPPRLATLSYDAVSLVAALAHTQNDQRYQPSVLANPSGFNGADGLFRFRASGLNDRGLVVVQISDSAVQVISPAPKSFAGG